jgi:hypothetical protein
LGFWVSQRVAGDLFDLIIGSGVASCIFFLDLPGILISVFEKMKRLGSDM